MGTGKLSGKPDEMRGGNLAMELASHPEGRGGGRVRYGVVILLVASCYIETGISSS